MNDTYLKIRISKGELDKLKEAAEKTGKSVSEYVRGLFGHQEIIDEVVLDVAFGKPEKKKSSGRKSKLDSLPSFQDTHKPVEGEPTCPHGKRAGWMCGFCPGGKAVV